MKILITGGMGFIGSYLTEKYLKSGHSVYIIDDLSTGSRENIKHLIENNDYDDRLFLHEDTILNEKILLELIGTCDLVIHLAAAVGVKYILDHPLDSITTNIQGTEIVLKYCDKFKKRLFLASTSEVYGKHVHAPLVETDDSVYGPSIKSRWSYAASKLVDEFTALAYHSTKNLEVVIGRLFNTVGPRQTGRYGMVIPRFFDQAMNDQPITIYGDGEQTRTFTHVDDVTNAIIKLMDDKLAYGQMFNIGGIEEISIKELAQKIIEITNSNSKIDFIPYNNVYKSDDFEDMQRRVPSVEKIKKQIDWEPKLRTDAILKSIHESLI